jgi:hypothetical protein
MFLAGRARQVYQADNITAICEPIVDKVDTQHLATF